MRSSTVCAAPRAAPRKAVGAGQLCPAPYLRRRPGPWAARRTLVGRAPRAAPSDEVPRSTTLDDLKAILLERLDSVDTRLDSLGTRLDSVDTRLDSVDTRLDSVDTRLDSLDTRTSQLQAANGFIMERLMRTAVDDMFGVAYSRPLVARSLQDLALLWPPGQTAAAAPGEKLPPAGEPVRCTLQLATAFAKALAASDIPRQLVLGLRPLVAAADPSTPEWADEHGQLRVSDVGGSINRMKDQALASLLGKLLRVAKLSGEEQVEELLSCTGAGVACAVAAAFPHAYLAGGAGGGAAGAGGGAAPARSHYSGGVQQLGVRLGVLRWLLVACCGVPEAGVRAVGRLFVTSGVAGAAPCDESQEEVARSLWGFSLYLHRP
ncbi:MAG: hypothetical protein J3K34DRAFT_407548 [Monoraphidium minutum]|nr:MAG: hypothetical protein J3K34DRAFT_407548 [Monoraphidium minutum]